MPERCPTCGCPVVGETSDEEVERGARALHGRRYPNQPWPDRNEVYAAQTLGDARAVLRAAHHSGSEG